MLQDGDVRRSSKSLLDFYGASSSLSTQLNQQNFSQSTLMVSYSKTAVCLDEHEEKLQTETLRESIIKLKLNSPHIYRLHDDFCNYGQVPAVNMVTYLKIKRNKVKVTFIFLLLLTIQLSNI